MSNTVYRFGYQGHKPEHLLAECQRLGALLLDIRYAPYSRHGWHRKTLQSLFGLDYLHVPQLGNIHYKGGLPMEIADMETGLSIVFEHLQHRPVVLMCVCKEFERCHQLERRNFYILTRLPFTVPERERTLLCATNQRPFSLTHRSNERDFVRRTVSGVVPDWPRTVVPDTSISTVAVFLPQTYLTNSGSCFDGFGRAKELVFCCSQLRGGRLLTIL
jgi:hypothetical protein